MLDCVSVTELLYLIGAGKQWFAGVHFDQYTAKTPRVDGKIVRQAQQYLW